MPNLTFLPYFYLLKDNQGTVHRASLHSDLITVWQTIHKNCDADQSKQTSWCSCAVCIRWRFHPSIQLFWRFSCLDQLLSSVHCVFGVCNHLILFTASSVYCSKSKLCGWLSGSIYCCICWWTHSILTSLWEDFLWRCNDDVIFHSDHFFGQFFYAFCFA